MGIPYYLLFIVILAVYIFWSQRTGLDSRYPILLAIPLLVGSVVVDATGHSAAAFQLAEFVFFLLVGGVVLLVIDHLRDAWDPSFARTKARS